MQTIDRVPPHNLEAEQALLGAILLDNEVILYAQDKVKPSDFYRQSHALLYEVMLDLLKQNKPMDTVMIRDHCTNKGILEKIGGVEYLVRLQDVVPTSASHDYYSQIIADKSRLRRTLNACHQGVESIYTNGSEPNEIITGIGKALADIQADELTKTSYDIGDLLDLYHQQIVDAEHGKSQGLTTRFTKLNKMTRGFQRGDLIILAARPSQGKTSLALNWADEISAKGKTVAFFSLEVRAARVSMNLIAARAQVNVSKIRPGVHFNNEEHNRIYDALDVFEKSQFFLDDAATMNMQTLRAKVMRIAVNYPLEAVFVDYLQLLQPGKRCSNREQEIAHISRSLKALAKEMDIPVFALAQLNRDLEKRPDHRPRLSDLRESGALEADADLIMLLWRKHWYTQKVEDDGKAELIIAKQRHGPIGSCPLLFTPHYTRFDPDKVRELENG